MKIYAFPTFNVTKILYTAAELGQECDIHWLDPSKGEHKTPEHLCRHPLGKVPVVELDGQCYFESNAICRLLAELNDNRLYGDTPQQRAMVNQWLDMVSFHMGRWLQVYFFEEKIKPKMMGAPTDEAALEEAKGFLEQQLPVLDKRLSEQDYLAGPDLSLADTIAFSYFETTDLTSVSLDPYPDLRRWFESYKQRDSYTQVTRSLPGGSMFSVLND